MQLSIFDSIELLTPTLAKLAIILETRLKSEQ